MHTHTLTRRATHTHTHTQGEDSHHTVLCASAGGAAGYLGRAAALVPFGSHQEPGAPTPGGAKAESGQGQSQADQDAVGQREREGEDGCEVATPEKFLVIFGGSLSCFVSSGASVRHLLSPSHLAAKRQAAGSDQKGGDETAAAAQRYLQCTHGSAGRL